jgi:hypothetical protein
LKGSRKIQLPRKTWEEKNGFLMIRSLFWNIRGMSKKGSGPYVRDLLQDKKYDPTLEKLDRILVTKEWEQLFPRVQVYKLPREISDHKLLPMMTRQSPISRKRDFRFEIYWLKNADCMERVKEIWGQPTQDSKALDRVLFKLKKVKNFLKGWGFNKAGSNRKKEERN